MFRRLWPQVARDDGQAVTEYAVALVLAVGFVTASVATGFAETIVNAVESALGG